MNLLLLLLLGLAPNVCMTIYDATPPTVTVSGPVTRNAPPTLLVADNLDPAPRIVLPPGYFVSWKKGVQRFSILVIDHANNITEVLCTLTVHVKEVPKEQVREMRR